jgi:hypothetical protein
MSNKVQCITKNQRLEGRDTVTDVSFMPFSSQVTQPMYAQGAVIGTPNAPQPRHEEAEPEQPGVILNSGFGLTIRDKDEAEKYEVGKLYLFYLSDGTVVEPTPSEAEPRQNKAAQPKTEAQPQQK